VSQSRIAADRLFSAHFQSFVVPQVTKPKLHKPIWCLLSYNNNARPKKIKQFFRVEKLNAVIKIVM